MSEKKTILKVLAIFIVALMIVSFTTSTVKAVAPPRDPQSEFSDVIPDTVTILSDDTDDLLKRTGLRIYYTISAVYPKAQLVFVHSLNEFAQTIKTERSINIYVLEGSLSGVRIGPYVYKWTDFQRLILENNNSYHILGFGNTHSVVDVFNNSQNVFVEGSEVIDAEFTFLYALWKTADILNQSLIESKVDASEKIRLSALLFYQDNAQDLYMRVIEPEEPLGEQIHTDLLAKLEKEAYIELVEPTENGYKPVSYDDVRTIMKVIPSYENRTGPDYLVTDSNNDTFVPITKVPEKSGLPGPIASIVDKLLKLLLDWFKDKTGATSFSIGLNLSIVNTIADFVNNTMLKIKKWVKDNLFGVISGGTAGAAFSGALTYSVIVATGKQEEFWNFIENQALKATEALSDFINKQFAKLQKWLTYKGEYPIGLGSFSAFKLKFALSLYPQFQIMKKGFVDFINYTIFQKGLVTDYKSAFMEMLKPDFLTIMPLFNASLEMSSIDSDKNSFFKYLLESLGLKLSVSGGGGFALALFKTTGSFDNISYFEIVSWFFKFSVQITKSFTLLDFISGGATSTGPMALIQEFLGLDKITIDIFFKIALEIAKKAAKEGKPSQSLLTLEITIGAALNIQILIVDFYGAVEVTLKFFQNLTAGTPLEIFLILHLYIKVKINLVFLDIKARWDWYPLSKDGLRLTPAPATPDFKENAQGLDDDNDGLSNDFENARSDLDSQKYDTDGDGLSDLEELSVTYTIPNVVDTDGDGLTDGDEYYKYHTDPTNIDTDRDMIPDGSEINIYNTNPLVMDTDEDGLSDFFEINYSYPLVNVTPSVTAVYIGGVAYNDRTDPLNPDTDDDGLLDGEEWHFGQRYGDPMLFNSDTAVGPLIIFNGGYTHPLDNDTDDDSYEQLSDGSLSPRHQFLYDMRDGVEVHGRWIMFINATTGDPEFRYVVTNPCIPDSDGDTAPGSLFLISDGYELSLTPPSDPNDADTDDDGLIDGLEGMNIEDGNHTNYNNPDTDNDGLNDLLDTLLPTDPRNPDTDGDYLLDGEEYITYGTSPYLNDTDYDGLTDGEELLFFYTNPLAIDSDLDGLNDGEEVLIYNTDPMNPDTDKDGLTDFYEIFTSHTNPFNPDTDNDTLTDGDELTIYFTDPLNWDTDGDSIMQLNEHGEISLNWGDNIEIMNGTDPTASDTDGDGLTDGQEVYLAKGAASFKSIPLDPLNNDTDGDGLLDGDEVSLQNISIITYPYYALILVYPFNTDPLNNDTDNDGLNDKEEVSLYGTNPRSNDTDGDTLPDYDEVYIHGTSPANNDTDGDDIPDNEEVTNATSSVYYTASGKIITLNNYHPRYMTSANNSDTDGDLLPDGEEIYRGTDPMNPDSNGNGIQDGYEFDEDGDGLSDGEEFYLYKTNYLAGGGFNNSDSDGDGLSDGDEVHIYGTNATNPDTDGDGFPDGVEIEMGTDPTDATSASEIGERPKGSLYLWLGFIAVAFVLGIIIVPLIGIFSRMRKRRKANIPHKKVANAPEKSKKSSKPTSSAKRRTSSSRKTKEGKA